MDIPFPPKGAASGGRLVHLDGLRTVAIVWVAFYHYFYFWTPVGTGQNLMPHGDVWAKLPLVAAGDLGVYMFFVISGLVISMSLDRSARVADFVVSRFVRLWPTALLCGFLTWIATKSLGPDIFERSFYEYLVSITFMPPRYIGGALGHPEWRWIDGAYWSLWTEVRFYAVAAFIFFLSRRSITIGWMLFAFASFLLHLAFLSVPSGMLDHASGLVFTEYQPYFTVGIGLALWRKGTDNRAATLFVAFGIAQAFLYECLIPAFKNPATPHLIERFIGLIVVFVLPYCALWRTSIVNFLSFSAIVKLGQASYVFYLLHQNFGIALYKYVNAGDGPANPLWTLPLFAVIALLSLFLHARFEVPVMVRLSKMLKGSRDSKKPSHD